MRARFSGIVFVAQTGHPRVVSPCASRIQSTLVFVDGNFCPRWGLERSGGVKVSPIQSQRCQSHCLTLSDSLDRTGQELTMTNREAGSWIYGLRNRVQYSWAAGVVGTAPQLESA